MKVKVQQGREEINSIGGISLIGGLYNSLKSVKKADSMHASKVKTGKIKHSGIIKTVAGLFALGKNDYADVIPFHKDSFFRDCLKLNAVPSEATLRQRLDELALPQEMFTLTRSGNVELVGDNPIFEDLLGTSLGTAANGRFQANELTAFGEPVNASSDNFFTGKPFIGELGYAFLFRNYRADKGKWQTQDPLGYPDGWNNSAYVNNNVADSIDFLGAGIISINDNAKMKIITDTGREIVLTNPSAQTTIEAFTSIKAAGQTITSMHNIGHASSEMIYINNNNEILAVNAGGIINITNLDTGYSINITNLLKSITDANSDIYLDGCHTAESSKWLFPTETDIAKEMSKILDATVSGNTGYAMYPGAGWNTLSDKESYKNGVKE